MKTKPKCSIIIRTFNEERWISKCLNAIYDQTYKNFEVIIVDNLSKDKTISRAKEFNVEKIVEIKDYLPGKALNLGIRESEGDYIVMISSHCIPVDKFWLENLVNTLEEDSDYAGVYGRQEPMSFSSASTKRDLMLVFGLDPKIQIRDGFFHNANSIIKKKIWNKYPFDEVTTNIEDRLWGQEMIHNNFKLKYEPEASVYHYHGIHQDGHQIRLRNVVNIIENQYKRKKPQGKLDASKLKILALIPVRGLSRVMDGKHQLFFTINAAKNSRYIDRIVVVTDTKETADTAIELGAECPFIRPKNLSEPHVNLEVVQQYALEKIEEQGYLPDLILHLEETFPFRPPGLLDHMIDKLLEKGYDSIVAARAEAGWLWYEEEDGSIKRLDSGDIPREFKKKSLIGLHGLACITHPEFVRNGQILGQKIGLFKVDHPLAGFEVRDSISADLAVKLLHALE